MFVGHFALGFAAKRTVPRVPLALLFFAVQLADTLWPILIAAGIEHVRIEQNSNPFLLLDFISYPYSHSLLLLAIWGVALAAIYRASSPSESASASVVLFALVVSHWVLDWITHRPDMPLYPGGPTFGLGLWNSVVATVCIELVMFGVGVWIYARATRARDAVGRWALVGLVALLLVAYLASLGGSAPPSVAALATVALIGAAITLAIAWWVDCHRVTG